MSYLGYSSTGDLLSFEARSVAAMVPIGGYMIALFALLLNVASSAEHNASRSYCLQTQGAHRLASGFASMSTHFSLALALQLFAPEIKLYSSSTQAILEQCASASFDKSLVPLYRNRAELIGGESVQQSPYEQLNMWHSCDTITIRYQLRYERDRIVGMVVLRTSLAPAEHSSAHWIHTVYDEYNSRALEAMNGAACDRNTSSSGSESP